MNTGKATVKRIIERAAELVDAGWCQGFHRNIVDGKVCHCVTGALSRACGDSTGEDWKAAYDLVCDSIRKLGFRRVSLYNDHPDRTKDEVVEMLRNAARSLEVGG